MYQHMQYNLGGDQRGRNSERGDKHGHGHHGRHQGGWHHMGRHGWGRGGFAPWMPLLFIVGFFFFFRFALYFLPVLLIGAGIFFAVRFFMRASGMPGGIGEGGAQRWSEEKRKRDFEGAQDADYSEKPKNRPARYYVGDDGELVELPPDEQPGKYV